MSTPAAPSCEHVDDVRHDWSAVAEPLCADCAREGLEPVSLRRCLTCGSVGCCDSSPGKHATGHHQATGHPMVETLQPGQDWMWCYVDEVTLRESGGGFVEVDLFYEAGLGYMREHLEGGGGPSLSEDHIHGRGFPLGRWVAEMRRRHDAGELSEQQTARIEELPDWRWGA